MFICLQLHHPFSVRANSRADLLLIVAAAGKGSIEDQLGKDMKVRVGTPSKEISTLSPVLIGVLRFPES